MYQARRWTDAFKCKSGMSMGNGAESFVRNYYIISQATLCLIWNLKVHS